MLVSIEKHFKEKKKVKKQVIMLFFFFLSFLRFVGIMEKVLNISQTLSSPRLLKYFQVVNTLNSSHQHTGFSTPP